MGKECLMYMYRESILCRPESYFPSDIHLGGVTLSLMLHTSLYIQGYFNKAKKKKKKKKKKKGGGGGGKQKSEREKPAEKKIRPSQTRSISILTYEILK